MHIFCSKALADALNIKKNELQNDVFTNFQKQIAKEC